MTAYETLIEDLEAAGTEYEEFESEDGFEVEAGDEYVWYFDSKGNLVVAE